MVSSGESYPLLAESGDWVKIDYNGREAWLSSKFCTLIYDSVQGEGMDDDDPGCWTGDDEEVPMVVEPMPASGEESEIPSITEQVATESGSAVVEAEVELPTRPVADEEATSPAVVSAEDDNSVHTSAERQAEFPGGMQALMRWLSSNVRYPESAQKNDVQGRVIVKFIVEKDGSITNAQLIRSVDSDLDKEALRVVSRMPKWTPAKNGGVAVRSYYTLPVNFRLQEQ
ncbi:MAG: energy transducer TonB [Muribaculaceae bacterium]|nr:energy transducer TonB [Muribaculaceae bacterium]